MDAVSDVPASNVPEYRVSEIAGAVKRVVEDNFGYVRVRGEISGFKRHGSGHCYFALKDEQAVLDAVCWKGTVGKLSFAPEDGVEVVASGRMTTYPGRSKYQLVVSDMAPAGVGALMALLEKRRVMLAAEGLFDAGRKKALPFMPQVIGVVTSPTGAVIRDILHRLGDRFPVRVLVWPVAVQGEGAAEQIAAAVAGFNALEVPPDVLIVARGGGSLEDLWAFNEEVVVRAVAASKIPVISAVGHETDTTLIDFAADVRAPTPTAAAEMAVPVLADWLLTVGDLGQRLARGLVAQLSRAEIRLAGLVRGLPRPGQLLEMATQRLDEWGERLGRAMVMRMERAQHRLALAQLRPTALMREITHGSERLAQLQERMRQGGVRLVEQKGQRLEALGLRLESVSYTNTLKRGFVLVRDAEGKHVASSAVARAGEGVVLEFSDGVRGAVMEGDVGKKKVKKPVVKVGQEELF